MPGPRRPGPGLPGYAWDRNLNNYVNLSTQRMVKRSEIIRLLTEVSDGAGERLSRLAQQLHQGTLTERQFYEIARREVKHAYNANVALGKGGWHQVTQAEWGRNGALLRQEYARLKEFGRALASGELSEAQAVARARLYADSAYAQYWRAERGERQRRGLLSERWRTVGDERVCDICLGLEAQGCQPLGILGLPGDPHPGCRCSLEACEEKRS